MYLVCIWSEGDDVVCADIGLQSWFLWGYKPLWNNFCVGAGIYCKYQSSVVIEGHFDIESVCLHSKWF